MRMKYVNIVSRYRTVERRVKDRRNKKERTIFLFPPFFLFPVGQRVDRECVEESSVKAVRCIPIQVALCPLSTQQNENKHELEARY